MPIVKAVSETFFTDLNAIVDKLELLLPSNDFTRFSEPLSWGGVYRSNGTLEQIYKKYGEITLAQLAEQRRSAESLDIFNGELDAKFEFYEQFRSIIYDWRTLMKQNGGAHRVNTLIRQKHLLDLRDFAESLGQL